MCIYGLYRSGRYEVDGYVYNASEEPKILMTGKWNESMSYQPCDGEGEPLPGTELKEVCQIFLCHWLNSLFVKISVWWNILMLPFVHRYGNSLMCQRMTNINTLTLLTRLIASTLPRKSCCPLIHGYDLIDTHLRWATCPNQAMRRAGMVAKTCP